MWLPIGSELSKMYFAWVVADVLDSAYSLIYPSLGKMTKRGNSQQKKETEAMFSATKLIHTNICKMSEQEFRIAIIKLIARLEKKHK